MANSSKEPSVEFEAYMIPGFLLQGFGSAAYSIVLYTIYQLRKADKNIPPFYHVYFYIGIVDVIHSIALIWMNFLLSAVRGDKFTVINYCASLLTCFCYLVNIIGNGIMAVNRYSATFNTHIKHFSNYRTHLYLVLTIIVSAICSIPAALREKTYTYSDEEWKVTVGPEYLVKMQRYIIVTLMVIYFIVAVSFTFMAHHRISEFISQDKYHKSDNTLLLFVSAHIFLHFWMLLYEICEIYSFDSPIFQFFHRYVYFAAFNMITVSNGFFILATTEKVQRAVFKTVRIFKTSRVSNTSNFNNKPIYSVPTTF